MWNPFRRRQDVSDRLVRRVEDLAAREAQISGELAKVQHEMHLLQIEQQTVHDQVRKWMRRAVAAERVVEHSESRDEAAAAPTPAPAAAPRWGARGRRAARAAGFAHQQENGDG